MEAQKNQEADLQVGHRLTISLRRNKVLIRLSISEEEVLGIHLTENIRLYFYLIIFGGIDLLSFLG